MGMPGEIILDLDRERIRTILKESYTACEDLLGVKFEISQEEFVSKINPYLDSNRVSIPVRIDLPTRKYPGMVIEVDLRRKKVFARIPSHRRNHPKQVYINRYLKSL
jgi:hypothetical protein